MYRNQLADDSDYYYAAKGVMAPSADFETVQFGTSKGSKKTVEASVPVAKPSAISKIKKAKANQSRSRPAAVVHAIIDVVDTPLSPMQATRNPFACLASPEEPTPKPIEKEPAAMASPPKAANVATPIARRTRMAAKAIGDVVSATVKAVSMSPAFLKSKSAILKHGKALGGAATRARRASGLSVMSAAAVN